MKLFDSHCHFTDPGFDDCRDQLAEEIRTMGLTITDIGTDLNTSLAAVSAAQRWEFCYAAVGYHPAEVEGLTEETLAECLKLYGLPKVVAIGEIGLDSSWEDNPPRELQQYWFRRQLQEARRLGAPVCIHSRDADGDTMDILREEIFSKTPAPGTLQCGNTASGSELCAPAPVKVLMHCYSGSAEMARQYVKLGAKISIAGPVTYKNARRNVEVVEALDLSDILIETDSPYLSPVPMRGKQNRPPYVRFTAEKIAEIKGISAEEVADATYRNACAFYGIDPAQPE